MSTALIPVFPERPERSTVRAERRARADFIAHLIATTSGAPQTRARRRAAPEEALAAYRALGQWPTGIGRTVSRSL